MERKICEYYKHSTLCYENENGGLKNVDVFSKVVSMQCYWIKRWILISISGR